MKLVDFLSKNGVVADLSGVNKVEVLARLAEVGSSLAGIPASDIFHVLKKREDLASTGIGDGVAIPHGTLSALDHLVVVFGRARDGIEFDSLDGEKTHLFFVLLTPDTHQGLQALARVSRILREARVRQALIDAPDRDSLFELIMSEDARI